MMKLQRTLKCILNLFLFLRIMYSFYFDKIKRYKYPYILVLNVLLLKIFKLFNYIKKYV